jgi:Na+-transporting NADH:ubiquinone oxidoreductase subunit F
MIEVGLGALVFTSIVMCLALLVLLARRLLVVQGEVQVLVNERLSFRAPIGRKLLAVLLENGVQVPSACGGSGTCGLCRVTLTQGAPAPLAIEAARIPAKELRAGLRLACQVTLREDASVSVSEALADAETFECVVRSNRNVATFIKELELTLPEGRRLEFRAGAYVQLTCPPHRTRFADFHIDPPFDAEWQRLGLRKLEAAATQATTRAYSLANPPGEPDIALLDVRIATPPPGSPAGTPPGVVSSWIFGLEPGARVTIAGPFGHFHAAQSEREMVFVGGGAGMAPMRSHIFDQLERLHSERQISFWYGARSRRELFYVEDFDRLQAEHGNFRWVTALSEPLPEDEWQGQVGFIHQVLHDEYLAQHPAPEACEYYLCGPPMMIRETRRMLDALGVAGEDVHFDDFGG